MNLKPLPAAIYAIYGYTAPSTNYDYWRMHVCYWQHDKQWWRDVMGVLCATR